jgi:uncharacterized protein
VADPRLNVADPAKSPDLREILRAARTIAVVGLSSKEHRASNSVARYMQAHGYRIVPVNPKEAEVLGEPAFASLMDFHEPVDIVDVFRRSEHTPAVAEQAVAIGARVLWLQLGIRSEEARRIAEVGGLAVVMDSCIKVVHQNLIGEEMR